jgi:hypothetical protein
MHEQAGRATARGTAVPRGVGARRVEGWPCPPSGESAGRAAGLGERGGRARRPASGPRPVRPQAVARAGVPTRPSRLAPAVDAPWPVASGPWAGGLHRAQESAVLPSGGQGAAGPAAAPREARGAGRAGRTRRVLAAVAVVLASALVVIGLGLLAEAAQAARAPGPPAGGAQVVAAEPGETVQELARRIARSAAGRALPPRIAAALSPGSARLQPGQLVEVPER